MMPQNWLKQRLAVTAYVTVDTEIYRIVLI